MEGDNSMAEIDLNLENWMENLPPELHHIPLCHLAIPGSHDSCSYSINPDSPLAPDEPLLQNSRVINLLGCMAKKVIYNWSKTQTFSCLRQLESGIRYFDFRVASKESQTEDLHVVHGLYGAGVESMIDEVKQFLAAHPKEVVMLDFQHFYKMTNDNHYKLLRYLTETFADSLCPFTADLSTVSLDWLWKKNYQVLLFYRTKLATYHPFLWPSEYIPNPWANTCNIKSLLTFLSEQYYLGRAPGKFHVTQGVLTPTLFCILRHVLGTLNSILVKGLNEHLMNWLIDKSPGPQGLNVVMCDFIDSSSIPKQVVALNYKSF